MSANPSYLQKLIQTIVDICTPVGTICNFGGACPTGWMIIDAVKVYEDEHNRLYNYLVVSPNLEKGADEDGRKWVKMVNPDGRVLQCTTSVSLVWKLLEACLPNIVGEVGWKGSGFANLVTGAFTGTPNTSSNSPNMTGGGAEFRSVSLNASDGSAIYNGTELQCSALQALVCIKI